MPTSNTVRVHSKRRPLSPPSHLKSLLTPANEFDNNSQRKSPSQSSVSAVPEGAHGVKIKRDFYRRVKISRC